MSKKWQRSLLASACALTIAGCSSMSSDGPVIEEEKRRPNVVVIFADDLGYSDTGFQQQSQDVVTPRMDELAEAGTIFSAGYVTAAVSAPSRVSLMTGRYQQRFGYHNIIAPYFRDENVVAGIPTDIPLMSNYLKDAGYNTAIIGKWHDADEPEYWPHNRGFDEFFGFNNGAATYFVGPMNSAKFEYKPNAAIYRNGKLEPDFDDYLTDKFGDEAVDYIERNKGEEFFLYVPFNAVHAPMEAKQVDLDRFAHIKDEKRRTLLAMNYNMDENIGKIMDSLEEHDLMEDTIIFFLSDNGGKYNGNSSYNHPLRGQKGEFYDGGIRIPYTVTWKGTLPAGGRSDEPVSSLDILPTSLAAAGVDIQEEWQLEGANLLPLLKQETEQLEDRFLFWDNDRSVAVRERDWKMMISNKKVKGAKPQLFKISEDIGESKDISAQFPEELARLEKAYADWSADNESPRWGWDRKYFNVYKGYRNHEEKKAMDPAIRKAADTKNYFDRLKAQEVINSQAE